MSCSHATTFALLGWCGRRWSSRGGCHGRRSRGNSWGGTILFVCFSWWNAVGTSDCLPSQQLCTIKETLVRTRRDISRHYKCFDTLFVRQLKLRLPRNQQWRHEFVDGMWILSGKRSWKQPLTLSVSFLEYRDAFSDSFDPKNQETFDYSWTNCRKLQSPQLLPMKSNQTSS